MGKGGGKKALSILGFGLGFANPAMFGMASSAHLMAGLYGMSLGSTIWGAMHPSALNQDYGKFDTVMNTVNSEAIIPVIYGIRKWGGNQTYHRVENDNKRIVKHVVICEGEVSGVFDVRANDVKIGGLDDIETLVAELPTIHRSVLQKIVDDQVQNNVEDCSFAFFNGAKDQSPPENWEEVGGYKNCTWINAKLNLSEKMSGGNPNITMLVKGKKVWVYRRNGIGEYAWFYEWSDNPIWCVRDFIVNRRYGLGRYITPEMFDLDELVEESEHCDGLVAYYDQNGVQQVEKRYALNAILDQQRDAMDILGELLANFAGYIVFTNTGISIRIEKSTLSSYSFTDDTIIKDSMEMTQTPLTDNPNRYRVGFFDPSSNWTQVKVLTEDTVDQRQRGVIRTKDITLTGCLSQGQTLRLSRFFKDLNKTCSIVVSFATSTFAMHLQCGDVVNVTWNRAFTNMPFRILEIYDNGQGIYHIKARQYNDSIYNDHLGAEISIPNYTTIKSPYSDSIPEVTELFLAEVYYIQKTGSLVSYIQGKCILPSYQYFRQAIVEYRDDEVNWHYAGMTLDGNFTIPNIQIGKTYVARVRVENSAGRRSDGVVSLPVLTTGKNLPPGNISNFRYVPVSGGFLLTWNAVTDPDIDGYNIYQGLGIINLSSCELIAEKLYSTSLFVPITKTGQYTFHIIGVDTSGNKSEIPTTILAQFDSPQDVVGFDVVMNGSDLDFRWQPIAQSGIRYEIRKGEAWGYGEVVGKTTNSFYRVLFPAEGSHDFWIKGIDAYGNYSDNPVKASILLMPSNDRNVIQTIDQVVQGWKGAKINAYVVDGGLKVEDGAGRAEYICQVDLPKKYLARNWITTSLTGVVAQELAWGSANFTWESQEAHSDWKSTATIEGTVIKHQIAYFSGFGANVTEAFSFDKSLIGEKNGIVPVESKHVTYEDGRYKSGVRVDDVTKVSYALNLSPTFSTVFNIKLDYGLGNDVVYLTLVGSGGRLYIGYDNNKKVFFLRDYLTNSVEVACPVGTKDFVSIGISQTLTKRKLFVKSFNGNTAVSAEGGFAPVGNLTAVYLYPKFT